jgi:hypothetical protein
MKNSWLIVKNVQEPYKPDEIHKKMVTLYSKDVVEWFYSMAKGGLK